MKHLTLTFLLVASIFAHGQYTWAPQTSGVTWPINDIHFAPTGNALGIFGTFDGEIGRSLDGVNWTVVYNLPEINGDTQSDVITGVYIDDSENCIVATNGGQIYTSSDGGTSWNLQYNSSPGYYNYDLEESNGRFFVGGIDKVYYSDDLGSNWDSVSVGSLGSVTDLDFKGNDGVLTGADQIWKTSDLGMTWTQVTGLPHNFGINGVEITGPGTFFTVGDSGEIMGTDDNGGSWTSIVSGVGEDLGSIEFGNATHGIISGNNGTLLMTDQGGFANWDVSTHSASSSAWIAALHAQNSVFAWFGNQAGQIQKSPAQSVDIDITDIIGPDTICKGENYSFTIEYDVTAGTAVDPAFQVLVNGTNISGGYATHTGTFPVGSHSLTLNATLNFSSANTYGYISNVAPNVSQTGTLLDWYGITETENIYMTLAEVTTTDSPIYFCPDDEITLTATGGNNYTWYAGTASSTPLVSNVQYPIAQTNYIVEIQQDYCTVYDTVFAFIDANCTDDTTTQDTIVMQGEIDGYAFSPNGDGVNDNFVIDFLGEEQNLVTIFNRYGDEIVSFENYDNVSVVWDGTYQGKEVGSGTYYFVAEYGNNQRHVGWVQIVK